MPNDTNPAIDDDDEHEACERCYLRMRRQNMHRIPLGYLCPLCWNYEYGTGERHDQKRR